MSSHGSESNLNDNVIFVLKATHKMLYYYYDKHTTGADYVGETDRITTSTRALTLSYLCTRALTHTHTHTHTQCLQRSTVLAVILRENLTESAT